METEERDQRSTREEGLKADYRGATFDQVARAVAMHRPAKREPTERPSEADGEAHQPG